MNIAGIIGSASIILIYLVIGFILLLLAFLVVMLMFKLTKDLMQKLNMNMPNFNFLKKKEVAEAKEKLQKNKEEGDEKE